ncbi:radical SAM protein [Pseudarcicella hirudinis]|uniref:radical SAM protein n=1 Tax=Pseudarcicella hirudinis TaxID=1079859 RepID=UPI0035ED655D
MNNYLSTLRATIVVVKIASRCNLNCSYCYMYNMGDQTYLSQPKVMSDKVVDKLIERILGHCKLHNIDNYEIVLHGGEPLLAGKEFFRKFVSKANKILVEQGGIRVRYVVQTNGLLLSDDWCKLFAELKIGVGVSLDGTPEDNDQYRIDHKGKGSYDRIVKGLNQALNSSYFKEKKLGVGVLAVINIDSEPEAVYEHFKSLSIKYRCAASSE